MRSTTATLTLEGGVQLTITYEWYLEYDGEYTVVILEKGRDGEEYDYELICRQPVNSELDAEATVNRELRQTIQNMTSAFINIRS